MELKKYKLGEILDVTRGASLSGEFYATEGKYIRLTCGNFDYQNNCFKENKSKDNIYYVGDFKPEFLMEKGDIITPLTEQAYRFAWLYCHYSGKQQIHTKPRCGKNYLQGRLVR